MGWLSFGLVERASAFMTQFGLIVAAVACAVAGVALLSIRIGPDLVERFTGLDALKRTAAYLLFGVAVGCLCWFGGYRQARKLSQEAALRAEIALQKAIVAARDSTIAEKERRAAEIAKAQAAADARADELAAQNAALETQIKEFDNASHARDSAACLDRGGLRRLDSIR